jgi:hypothetical protein
VVAEQANTVSGSEIVQIDEGASDIERLVDQLVASPLSARSVVGLLGECGLMLVRAALVGWLVSGGLMSLNLQSQSCLRLGRSIGAENSDPATATSL